MAYDSDITPKARDLVVLERARDRIAEAWWHAPTPSTRTPVSLCVLLAVRFAAEKVGASRMDALAHLGFCGVNATVEAVAWNDAPGRTQAEVLARFDAAISGLRAAGRAAQANEAVA